MKRPARIPSRLSESLHRQLNSYALAATAAGVGMLALAKPAEGKIIYTRTNKQVGRGGILHLDLDQDGAADFELKNQFTTSTAGGEFDQLFALPARKSNAVWGHTVSAFRAYASALAGNVRVGPKGKFLPGSGLMAASSISGLHRDGNYSCTGPWANVSTRYLGLKFAVKGEPHFGWARLNVSCMSGSAAVNATLTGYAYETIANKPIVTGKTKGPDVITLQELSLGRLARGANRFRPDPAKVQNLGSPRRTP